MKYVLFIIWLSGVSSLQAQENTGLDSILSAVLQGNPSLKAADAQVRSLDEAARGARSWDAPLISTGLWMTPYNTGLWKRQADGSPGVGQYMVSAEQMIPNRKRLDAEERYEQGMSAVEKEKKKTTINELYAGVKLNYYQWIVLKKKRKVLDENRRWLELMLKSAELRYKNNLGKVGAYYKVQAALGEVENERMGLDNAIQQKMILLNTLMNRDKGMVFDIDTLYKVFTEKDLSFDSTALVGARSDIRALERDIRLTGLEADAERSKLKPEFGIRYDHMFGFGGTPMQYSLMGMMRLPLTGWSSRASRANVESLKWKAESLAQQRATVINVAEGQCYGLRKEILSKEGQIDLFGNSILPALQKNFQTLELGYEQNTEELFTLYDAWETLNKSQLEYLDELGQLLSMQVEWERLMEIK